MPKKFEDVQSKQHMPIGELNVEFAKKLKTHDSRLECFLNFEPPPIYLRPGGFFQSRRKTKFIVGANKSYKTSIAILEDVMIFTGIIPYALRGIYAYEKDLIAMTTGKTRRPRRVRIIVQDYSKAWPETVKPMLEGDPDTGGRGFLPEAWSQHYDKEEHIYYGPDGSILSIMSVDPTQKLDPRRLRGPLIDHTHICENSLQAAYSESLTRSFGLTNGPRDVTFEMCPQDGFEDWTYSDLYLAGYDSKTDLPLPKEKQNDAIFVQRVSMRDNPQMDESEIKAIEQSIPAYQVAFRVHGKYSAMAANPYFNMEMLQEWLEGEEYSDGLPYVMEEDDVDLEHGKFFGKLRKINEHDVDEKYEPVWRFWDYRRKGEKYILCADTSMGNPESDYQVADVLRLMDFRGIVLPFQVAQLRMKLIKPGDFAVQCALMANYFGNCMLAPEVMGESGGIFVDRVRNYQNLYTRMGPPTKENNDKPVKKYGWHTDRHNKPVMLETLYKALQKCYGFGFCPINSEFTLNELMSYEERVIKDKTNTYMKTEWGNRPGANDDCVMSYAVGTRVGVSEIHRILACKISDDVVEPRYESELEKKAKQETGGNRPFAQMRPQKKLSELRSQLYARSGTGPRR